MSRYLRKLVTSAEDAWDGKLNDNFANIFDRPFPIIVHAGTLSSLQTAFPAAQNDQALAVCDYDGTSANGKMFCFSNGALWRHVSNWEMFTRAQITAITNTYTVLNGDELVSITGSNTFVLTLPAIAGTNKGRLIRVKFAGTGSVTVTPNGANTIDGAGTHVVAGSLDHAYDYISDGSGNWILLKNSSEHVIQTIPLIVAVSDETTVLTTGTAKITFRLPAAFTVTGVRASLTTASATGTVTVDINEGGTSILSTKLTIDATEKTSQTAATPAVISDSSLADDAELTIDIDNAGTSADATGLKVTILGTML